MPRIRTSSLACLAFALAIAGCRSSWNLKKFRGTNEQLYGATMREFEHRRWENAISGFEKLTTDLPARDTLLPRAHFYLGLARQRHGENLLAAQSFSRVVESFPDDTLADDALAEAGRAYERLWRKTVLDAQYGQTALNTYRTLLSLYPNSPLRAKATREIARLEEWFARKDYDNGMHYFRRRAYDSAIIYFKDVVRLYPTTGKSRDAYLRLLDSYRAIKYREDANEVCATLRQTYPGDREVRRRCGSAPINASAPRAPPAAPTSAAPTSTARDTTATRDSAAAPSA